MREKLSAPHAKCQTEQSKNCNCDDAYLSCAQCNAHDQRQGNCHRDGENAPGTLRQRLNNHQRQNRQQDNHDHQNTDKSEQANTWPDFVLHHLTERFSAATNRGKQNNHVVDASAERCADQNPECARQEPELRGQHRPNQRPRSGNRRKMVSENHPSIGRHIILVVILQNCRSSPLFVQHEHLCRQPFAVKAIADGQCAKPSQNNPERADLFAAGERQAGHRPHTQRGDDNPEQLFPPTHFIRSLVEIVAARHKL